MIEKCKLGMFYPHILSEVLDGLVVIAGLASKHRQSPMYVDLTPQVTKPRTWPNVNVAVEWDVKT